MYTILIYWVKLNNSDKKQSDVLNVLDEKKMIDRIFMHNKNEVVEERSANDWYSHPPYHSE